MTQVNNVCIFREKHKLYTQDRQRRFLRIVNVPSDMFNGEVYFPSFTTRNAREYDTRKCSENIPETF